MADPVTWTVLAIGAATAAAGAGATAYQARQQNKAVRASQDSARHATNIQNRQLAAQASQQLDERHREAEQIRGRIRVAAGEAGIGMGGSYGALMRQADFDLARNEQVIGQNYNNALDASNSGYAAQMAQLSSQVRNPMLDAFTGGLSGFSTGLSIGQGVRNLTPPKDVQ